MIFDGHQQIAGAGLAIDFDGVGVFERQRLDREDVLMVGERGHRHIVVERVGHGHDDDLAGRERGDGLAVEVRLGRTVAIGPGTERLTGEGAQQRFGTRQIAHGGVARRADGDGADAALALHVIERR